MRCDAAIVLLLMRRLRMGHRARDSYRQLASDAAQTPRWTSEPQIDTSHTTFSPLTHLASEARSRNRPARHASSHVGML